MEIRGVPFSRVCEIAHTVSERSYGGNVIVHRDARPIPTKAGGFAGRFIVADSSGPGARRSWTGRRMPVACWHAWRDILAAVFEEFPEAKARTAMARYDGLAGFERNYPATGNVNIGSRMQPAYMPNLCECAE